MRAALARPRSGRQETWRWPLASGSAPEPTAGWALEKTDHEMGSFREGKCDQERSDQHAQPPAIGTTGAQVSVVVRPCKVGEMPYAARHF